MSQSCLWLFLTCSLRILQPLYTGPSICRATVKCGIWDCSGWNQPGGACFNFYQINSLPPLTHVCMNISSGTRNRTENENWGKSKTIYFVGSASSRWIKIMKLQCKKRYLRCQVCRNLPQIIWTQRETSFRFSDYISGLKITFFNFFTDFMPNVCHILTL